MTAPARLARLAALCAALAAVSAGALAQSSPPGVTIDYTVIIKDPVAHLYDVQAEISGVRSATVDVAMPAWSPGSYIIRDHARNVQQFEASTRQGRLAPVERIDKQTWRISKGVSDDLSIRYRVYSLGLADDMADVDPASIFVYVTGMTQAPVTVRYELPNDWKIYSGLQRRNDRLQAANYDALIDAHALAGKFKVLEFESGGVPYRLVFSNPRIQMIDLQVTSDLEDMVGAATAMLGSPPFKDFVFLVRVQPNTGASFVARANSARMSVGENDFVNQASYTAFLSAAAQSLVRAWNGMPSPPEDYSKEYYDRMRWFTEGVSGYSSELLLVRSGLLEPSSFYARLSGEIDALQHQPGRKEVSLEEAGWNAWTRSDNSADTSLSYLLKGRIAGLLLDLDIRGRTSGARGLEDVLQHLATNYRNKGLSADALERAIEIAAGIPPGDFLDHVVRGTAELDYEKYAAPAGMRVNVSRGPSTIQFGIEFERIDANQARIRRIIPGSPAAAARLDGGDVLLAIDADRITFDNLTSRIHSKQIGKSVSLTVLRGDRLLTLNLTPAASQNEAWSLQERPDATPSQIQTRIAWLGVR